MKIIEYDGLDTRLFTLIGPLVMNPQVLKANNNYPFKTSEHFHWYIAIKGRKVMGFLPIERKKNNYTINNYYIADDDTSILTELLRTIPVQENLEAVVQAQHEDAFAACGYQPERRWSKYVKMKYNCTNENNGEIITENHEL